MLEFNFQILVRVLETMVKETQKVEMVMFGLCFKKLLAVLKNKEHACFIVMLCSKKQKKY